MDAASKTRRSSTSTEEEAIELPAFPSGSRHSIAAIQHSYGLSSLPPAGRRASHAYKEPLSPIESVGLSYSSGEDDSPFPEYSHHEPYRYKSPRPARFTHTARASSVAVANPSTLIGQPAESELLLRRFSLAPASTMAKQPSSRSHSRPDEKTPPSYPVTPTRPRTVVLPPADSPRMARASDPQLYQSPRLTPGRVLMTPPSLSSTSKVGAQVAFAPEDLDGAEECTSCGAKPDPTFVALVPCDCLVCRDCLDLLLNPSSSTSVHSAACFNCSEHVTSFHPAWDSSSGSSILNAAFEQLGSSGTTDTASTRTPPPSLLTGDPFSPSTTTTTLTPSPHRRSNRGRFYDPPVAPLSYPPVPLASPPRFYPVMSSHLPMPVYYSPPVPSPGYVFGASPVHMSPSSSSITSFTLSPPSSPQQHPQSPVVPAAYTTPLQLSEYPYAARVHDSGFAAYSAPPSMSPGLKGSGTLSNGVLSTLSKTSRGLKGPSSTLHHKTTLPSSPTLKLTAKRPTDWPCVRISNVPWDLTVAGVMSWLPQNAALPKKHSVLPIHLLSTSTDDGLVLSDCFIEVPNKKTADLLVRRSGTDFFGRRVSISHSCQAELLSLIFPSWEPGFAATEALEADGPGSVVLLSELKGLLELCKAANFKSAKTAERAYLNIVSIVTKFPFHQKHSLSLIMTSQRVFSTLSKAINTLVGCREVVDDYANILKYLANAAITCPTLNHGQRTKLADAAGFVYDHARGPAQLASQKCLIRRPPLPPPPPPPPPQPTSGALVRVASKETLDQGLQEEAELVEVNLPPSPSTTPPSIRRQSNASSDSLFGLSQTRRPSLVVVVKPVLSTLADEHQVDASTVHAIATALTESLHSA